jgi:hypothetical protein
MWYWLVVLAGSALIFGAGVLWSYRFLDSRRKSLLTTVTSSLSIIIALFCCSLAPLDAWDAANPDHPRGGMIKQVR